MNAICLPSGETVAEVAPLVKASAENAQARAKWTLILQKRPTTQNVYVAASASVSVDVYKRQAVSTARFLA